MKIIRKILFVLLVLWLSRPVKAAPTLAQDLTVQHTLTLAGVQSPATITSTQNDYNPTNLGIATILRLTSDTNRTITGLMAPSPATSQVIWAYNVNTLNNIILSNANVASAAANRFSIGSDITLTPGTGVILQYDTVQTRWVAASSVGGGSVASRNNPVTNNTGTSLTIDNTYYVVTMNNASPNTFQLPPLSGLTGYFFRVKNLGVGVTTVTCNGAETVFTTSAVASFQLATGESADLTGNAAYWLVQ